MPKILRPNNTFPVEIPNFPLAGVGEPVAIGPLEAAIQAVLDRTEHLHNSRVVLEGVGTKRIRHVASLADLAGLTGVTDGDTIDVQGYGRYRLYTNSALPADGLWVLGSASGGKWVHLLSSIKAHSSGLATLDSSGRLGQDLRDGAVHTVHIANGAVTSVKLAPDAVTSVHIANGAVKSSELDQDAVHTVHIADGAVTSAKLGLLDSHGNHHIGTFRLREGSRTVYAANLQWDGSTWRYVAGGSGAGYWAYGNNEATLAIAPYGTAGESASISIPLSVSNQEIVCNKPISTKPPSISGTFVPHWYIYDHSGTSSWLVGTIDNKLHVLYRNSNGGFTTSFHLLNDGSHAFWRHAYPDYDNYNYLGLYSKRWAAVYSAGGVIQGSDGRDKTDIQDEPLGLDFITALRPVAYRWTVGGYTEGEPTIEEREGTDGEKYKLATPNLIPRPGRRLHHGLIAQEVKAVLDRYGVDFGGWVLEDANDPDSRQSLRYDQFVAPLIKAVQELSSRVEALESAINSQQAT